MEVSSVIDMEALEEAHCTPVPVDCKTCPEVPPEPPAVRVPVSVRLLIEGPEESTTVLPVPETAEMAVPFI